ncbi:hypothetical protein BBJ28_00026465, partial [Nothophytophthora sp. Chile5]
MFNARFLQEDEDSASPVAVARKPRATGAYSASSASAVTSAAAALLASNKLKKHTSKSKNKAKNSARKSSKKTALSDSEEPPPSYYASSSVALSDASLDPYAFDMESAAFPLANQPDEDEAVSKTKRKEEKVAKKPTSEKEAVKTAPISLNDRVAAILKRTGSTQFEASLDDESDEDGSANETADVPGNEAREPVAMSQEGGQQPHSHDEEQKNGHEESDEARLSLSDSLGMESADFEREVCRQLGRAGRQRSWCEDSCATPSRYEQQQLTFLQSEKDDDSATEKDLYDDEDFELDQTTAGDLDVPPAGLSSAQSSVHGAPTAEKEQPF